MFLYKLELDIFGWLSVPSFIYILLKFYLNSEFPGYIKHASGIIYITYIYSQIQLHFSTDFSCDYDSECRSKLCISCYYIRTKEKYQICKML